MKYHPITNRLAKFLYQFIDRYDYGLMAKNDDDPRRQYSTARLNATAWGLKKLTKTHLEEHLFGDTRYYYTTRRASSIAFLKADIDAHDGERDAWDVASWIIDNYFQGAYFEQSTHGKGAHLYFALNVGRITRTKANMFIKSFSSALSQVVEGEGFESKVCGVYGAYTIKTNGIINEGDRGALAKIPRPLTMEQVQTLVDAPWFTWKALRTVVDDAEKKPVSIIVEKRGENGGESLCPLPPMLESAKQGILCATSLGTPVSPLSPSSPNPWHRKLWAITEYRRVFGVVPTEKDAIEYYEDNCITTGPRDRSRCRQIMNAIKSHEKWYNPLFQPSSPYSFKADQYLNLVMKSVPVHELYYRKSQTDADPLTYADVAVFISICTTISFSKSVMFEKARAARDRIIPYFRALKAQGIHDKSCNANKYQRLRDLCGQFGLLEIHDMHKPPDWIGKRKINGYGMLIGPGPIHPLYAQFINRMVMLNLKSGRAVKKKAQ